MGRLRLTTEQLERWHTGETIDFPIDPVTPVAVYRGLTKVGSGELITVDGELGIRLIEYGPQAT